MIEGKLDVVETALNRLWALIADRNLAPGQGSSSALLKTYSALRKDFQDFKESKIPTYQEYLRLKNLWDFLLYAIQQGLKPSEFLQELPSETARKMVEERLREYSKLSENSYIRKLLRLIEEEKQNECRDSKEST